VGATACSLGIPWTVKRAIDALGVGDGRAVLAAHVLLIIALAVGHGLTRLAARFAMIGAGQWVEHDLRRDVYERLQTLPPAFYHRHRTGDLMSRASNDVSTVRMLAGFGSTMVVQTILAFGGTLVAMWLLDPWLTLYALAPFPALILLTKRFGHVVEAQSAAVQEHLGNLSARVQENLAGMPVVRAYTMEEREIASFRRVNAEFLARSLALARSQAAYWPLMGLISGLGTLVVLWLGGKAVVEGRVTLGAFVAFNGYLGYLAWPTIALGWTLANVRRGLASMERIGEVLDAPMTADVGRRAARAIASPPLAVEVRNLTFAYDGREPALRDVSFRAPAGALIAVVGPTGSGKSTLGVLMCRLFEPPRGTIFVGETDVRDAPLGELRRAVSYVPQEPFLFSRTIRENVLLGAPTAGPEQVRDAAKVAALATEVEEFPDGWDTVVGERGLTLSGGQRQRAALARALVGDPHVLILDDPFASVDAVAETEILRDMRSARRGRTTILMTHRLRSAREADWIVALEEGVVAEQGTHADLLRSGGLYARLWRIQKIEDDLAQS
jgi:ATP-binding cassette subfamily B protein